MAGQHCEQGLEGVLGGRVLGEVGIWGGRNRDWGEDETGENGWGRGRSFIVVQLGEGDWETKRHWGLVGSGEVVVQRGTMAGSGTG